MSHQEKPKLNDTTHVYEEKPDHHYRTEIPNIVFDLGLSHQAIALYSYYKRVAGDNNACWRSNATIRKQIGMSANTLIKYRTELTQPQVMLGGKSLITAKERRTEKGDPDTVFVKIGSIWRENGDFYRSQNENRGISKSEGGVPQILREGTSNFEHKEEHYKKNPKNNNGTPSAVVVPSCLEKLEIGQTLKVKMAKKYTAEQIEVACACVAEIQPDNLEATIQAALRDGWEPKGAPEDQEAKNMDFLDKYRVADGKTLGPYKVQIGPRYIHFRHSRIDGSLDQNYKVDQKGFIGAIQALIAKHN